MSSSFCCCSLSLSSIDFESKLLLDCVWGLDDEEEAAAAAEAGGVAIILDF